MSIARGTTVLFRLFSPSIALLCIGGCGLLGGNPSAANIQLRKDKQALEARVGQLETRVKADAKVIEGLRERSPSVTTLPPERMARLVTTHGLKPGRLTAGYRKDPRAGGDDGVAVHIVPVDEHGDAIKAAGKFTIEAFDLANSTAPLVGKWEFDPEQVSGAWRGAFLDYNYVLYCPWQDHPPGHSQLTLTITFFDELTQTPFHTEQMVKVDLASATQPAGTTQPVGTTQPAATIPTSKPATEK